MEEVSFMLQEKSIWHLLSRRLGGFQNWSERFGEEKNLSSPLGIEPWILSCPLQSIVSTPTALSGFLWKLSNGTRRWKQRAITLTTVELVGRYTKKHVTHCCHLHTEIQLCYLMGALKTTRCWCVCVILLITDLKNWIYVYWLLWLVTLYSKIPLYHEMTAAVFQSN